MNIAIIKKNCETVRDIRKKESLNYIFSLKYKVISAMFYPTRSKKANCYISKIVAR